MRETNKVEDMNYFDFLAWLGMGSSHPGGFPATKQTLDTVQIKPEEYVLDAGCGSGLFDAVTDLFNIEVDLLFFDTTSTYFEMDEWDDEDFKMQGHSKDSRPDLPQIVIGLAVTRDGIPIRCWSWPGNTSDMTVIPEVKRDLTGWKLGRVITVADRGFSSEENLRNVDTRQFIHKCL